jgi:signal transduction histidine kinase
MSSDLIDTISHDAEHAAVLRAIAPRSLMTLPLLARGRTLGAITFLASAADHAYAAQDLALAWALADRAALAIDNAKLFRAREEMLSVVSHDLRNPLNVITVGVASLRRGVPDDRRATFLEKIRRAADRMNRLIEDLLDVTRLDSGSIALDRDGQAAAALVSETLEALRPLAEEKQIHLVHEVPEGTPAVHADRDRMLQVFGNIVGNAIKFTPAGGTVTVRAEPLDGAVRFSVVDSGPGISHADQARIFERFVQARRSDRKGGTGLGLAIAKGLVQAHGGAIGVASEPGAGATFYFSIPTDTSGATARYAASRA